ADKDAGRTDTGPLPQATASPPVRTGPMGSCTPGMSRPCYDGAAGTRGVGACHDGAQMCDSSGTFGACVGELLPMMEACGNGADDDCNGMVDDGCGECSPGMTRACYSGPTGTDGVGRCHGGTQTCDAHRH